MPRSTAHCQRRDTCVRRFLPLADAIARRFHHRYGDLLDRDDLIQAARLALVQAAARVTDQATAPAYLKRSITGALAHHLRDRALLVRLPARQQHALPWRHLSLDEPAAADGSDSAGLSRLDLLAAPPASPADAADSLLVEQLLALLQPSEAAALQETVLNGLSLRQAAERLGVSAMTVTRRRSQALQRLRLALTTPPPSAAPAPAAAIAPAC
jgi:RNA polymerase sigma factor (sigma-70 family)